MRGVDQDLLAQTRDSEEETRNYGLVKRAVAVVAGVAAAAGAIGMSPESAEAEEYDPELYIDNPACGNAAETGEELKHGIGVRGLDPSQYPYGGILQFVISWDSDSENVIDRSRGEIPGIMDAGGSSMEGIFYARVNGERDFTAEKVEVIASGTGILHTFEDVDISFSCDLPAGEIPVGGSVPTGGMVQPFTPKCKDFEDGLAGGSVFVNITNTNAQGPGGFGSLRSSDATPNFERPENEQISHVNFAFGEPPTPNGTFSEIGADGICYDQGPVGSHVILDVVARFPSGTVIPDATRFLDTRP